ncbi:MAG TPA: glycoside hydrolase family 20 zincin-like fold domain-containing protein [Acidobacteriaceae bacterium]|nr:glycoside hydrolase family 20 zincin-like fold domain-containing protein [Acidobacteriaceae bacterium]
MSISRSGLALLAVWLVATGTPTQREARGQTPAAQTRQAPAVSNTTAATNLPAQTLKLIPIPREVSAGAVQSLVGGLQINCAAPCAAEDQFAIEDLKAYLASLGVAVNSTSAVNILVARYGSPLANSIYNDSAAKAGGNTTEEMPAEMKPEGYAMHPDGKGLALTAASDAGIFYALQTVKQLVTGSGANAVLHTATIRDWPAMKYRGLDDDLSRGPVTTLEFEKKLIRTIAAYKINLYSPYFEHTATYAANPLIAPPGGGVSAADAAALVAYARLYHVTVVPEQEAFGHLHNALLWEQYQPLAETPHGAVLAPGQPGSIALIKQEFSELAAEYPGPFLHIGADETVDLGVGQTKADVDARGLAPVYLDFMQRVVTALAPLQRRLLFWGDIAQDSPALLKTLPQSFKDSTIAIAWGYNPEPRGFASLLTPFTNAGFETWVSPSVHNFRVVYPDNNMALPNIQQFTRDGQRLGSTGQLNTIWNDDGEGLINQDWYGILFGAAAAWQPGESSIEAFEQSYAQVFHGDASGALNQAQLELMAAHNVLKDQAQVGDATNNIFWLDPWSKDGQKIAAQVRPYTHDLRLHAEAALTLIAQARAVAGPNPASTQIVQSGIGSTSTLYDAAKYGAASSNLREPDAIDAMELGARRMDFIGLKFQLADEMAAAYARAVADSNSTDRKLRSSVNRELSDMNSVGYTGRIEDIRNGYTLIRDLFESAWLRSNRPYSLRNVLEQYDYATQIWLARADKLHSAQRQWTDLKTLPPAEELGIPPTPVLPATPGSAPPAATGAAR